MIRSGRKKAYKDSDQLFDTWNAPKSASKGLDYEFVV